MLSDPAPSRELDLEALRACRFRLVLVARDGKRRPYGARLVTANARLMLFALSAILPESETPGGCSVEVAYASEEGLCSFLARAVAMSPRGGLWITRPEAIETLQRRAHFRLPAQIGGHVTVVRPDRTELGFNLSTEDLSAGGLRFEAPSALSSNDDLGIELALPAEGKIETRVRLVRCVERAPGRFAVGAYFERLPSTHESRIVRYLNHEQIRLRHSEPPRRPSHAPRVV